VPDQKTNYCCRAEDHPELEINSSFILAVKVEPTPPFHGLCLSRRTTPTSVSEFLFCRNDGNHCSVFTPWYVE
jgi:hypothetical protein